MNSHIKTRLEAIQQQLIAYRLGGAGLPNAVIGSEREHVLNDFLSKVLPSVYRFGRGSITDADGNLCGQIEVVLELPFGLNFPLLAGNERLYLAESVAAVIEVKSNLSSQWNEVAETTRKVKSLNRDLRQSIGLALQSSPDPIPDIEVGPKIPCYAIGYTGYNTLQGLKDRLSTTCEDSRPDGALVIDSGCFVGNASTAVGVWGLFALVTELVAQLNFILGIAYPNILTYGEIELKEQA